MKRMYTLIVLLVAFLGVAFFKEGAASPPPASLKSGS